jgi:hypothetical protein
VDHQPLGGDPLPAVAQALAEVEIGDHLVRVPEFLL